MNASASLKTDEEEFPFLSAAGLESMIWENAELRRDVMGTPERWEEIRTSDELLDKYFGATLANCSGPCRHIFEWFRAADFTWEKICPPPPTGRADGQEYWSREFYRKVFVQELQYIENRRISIESDQDGIFDQGHAGLSQIVGLSLSGGGIRSAIFHLGVIQALHAKGVLRYVDYISTVSGGGYVGATLSALLRKPLKSSEGRSTDSVIYDVVEHLRRHRHYLAPNGFRDFVDMGTTLAKGIFINFLAVLPFLMLAAIFIATLFGPTLRNHNGLIFSPSSGWLTWVLPFGAAITALLSMSLVLRLIRWRSSANKAKSISNKAGQITLYILPIGLLIAIQPLVLSVFHSWEAPPPGRWAWFWVPILVTTILTFVGGHLILRVPRFAEVVGPWVAIGFGSLLPFAVYLLFAELAVFGGFGFDHDTASWILFSVAIGLWFWSVLFLDVNETSIHPFYRDRLANAYILEHDGKQVTPVPKLKLSELCMENSIAPYAIINCAINLQAWHDRSGDDSANSKENEFDAFSRRVGAAAGRGSALMRSQSDYFVFSKLFTGSERTGYYSTATLEKVLPSISLASAVAISGAAASPNMGTYTNRMLVPLMMMLNIRLGFWLPHPLEMHRRDLSGWVRGVLVDEISNMGDSIRLSYADERLPDFVREFSMFRQLSHWFAEIARPSSENLDRLQEFLQRSFWRPGPANLVKETASALTDDSKTINISDGGHIENLGLVELLRRRCRLIIAGDAGADPDHRLNDIKAIIEIAREQFGIVIEIDLSPLYLLKSERSTTHHLIGTINYPPVFEEGKSETGYLLYIKACLTGDESETITKYSQGHSSFPHEPITDQFFSAQQFEAYRKLGSHSALSAFNDFDATSYAALDRHFATANPSP